MQNCEKCGRKKWVKTGELGRRDGYLVRVWQCRFCPNKQMEESPFKLNQEHKPAVLYFDIESSPHEVLTWDLFIPSKRLSIDNMLKERFIICWAAAWLDEVGEFQKVYSRSVTSEQALAWDDKPILKDLYNMLDRADYVIGHNSKNFDVKMANWRFHHAGMGLPYNYKQIDTLQLSRKYYRPPSHGLDHLAPCWGGEKKMHMEFGDWKRIVTTGDPCGLLQMETYCRGDVRNGAVMSRNIIGEIEASGRAVYGK